jgi:hypothetical protein
LFLDIVIVVAGFWLVTAFLPVLAWSLNSERKRAARQRVTAVPDLLPRLEAVLKFGADGATLAITPVAPGRHEELKLTKYIKPDGAWGLECLISTRFGPRNFTPGRGAYRGSSDWPRLAAYLNAQRIAFSEFRSPVGEHWSNSYHLLRFELGQDCPRALQFVAFFFRDLLDVRTDAFSWKMTGLDWIRRLAGIPVTTLSRKQRADTARAVQLEQKPWYRRSRASSGDLKDLHVILVQVLGLAGFVYSLAFAAPDWPAARFPVFGTEFVLRIFDFVFAIVFVTGAFGRAILVRAKRYRFPLVALLLAAFMETTHRIMCLVSRVFLLAKMGKLRGYFAHENAGLAGMFIKVTVPPDDVLRKASFAVTTIALLACAAAIYRSQI